MGVRLGSMRLKVTENPARPASTVKGLGWPRQTESPEPAQLQVRFDSDSSHVCFKDLILFSLSFRAVLGSQHNCEEGTDVSCVLLPRTCTASPARPSSALTRVVIC